jgi:hypothetical protein
LCRYCLKQNICYCFLERRISKQKDSANPITTQDADRVFRSCSVYYSSINDKKSRSTRGYFGISPRHI